MINKAGRRLKSFTVRNQINLRNPTAVLESCKERIISKS